MAFYITMMFSIPPQFYADEHITLMVGVYRGREGKDRCRRLIQRGREGEGRGLSPLLSLNSRPSQMAVFSCMRLEDVSDSRCRFLGKLIFQAKLFLFWWRSTELLRVRALSSSLFFSLTKLLLSLRGGRTDLSDRLQVKRRRAACHLVSQENRRAVN